MAQYFLRINTFARGSESSVAKAAPYGSGERILDLRSGAVLDCTDRSDVAHAEIVLPSELAFGADMEWALDSVDALESGAEFRRQWNSRFAREALVLLVSELSAAPRVALVQGLSRGLADRYRGAVDFAIHEPRPSADQRHMLIS
jgi:MobA/MobL family